MGNLGLSEIFSRTGKQRGAGAPAKLPARAASPEARVGEELERRRGRSLMLPHSAV